MLSVRKSEIDKIVNEQQGGHQHSPMLIFEGEMKHKDRHLYHQGDFL